MLVRLHSQATTTPKVRAEIQASDEPAWVLADRHGTTEQTVYKWRHRDGVEDRSHTPHRLQTTLTPVQEAVAVALRKALLISLDDLLAVVREFLNPNASRSGLDRCLRRHGVGNLRDMKAKVPKPKHSAFKAYEPGYMHIDVKYLPQMADESRRRYLFVAIDRATRWVFIRIFNAKTAANARRFLRDHQRACPMRIRTILTDNGKEFTDRLFGLRKRAATGEHEFDKLCAALNIDHRLTPPKSPQTNGMVERFNGRIEEVLQSHHFRSGEELETTLHRYVWLYNQQLPQSALGSKTPFQTMKEWHKIKPELFWKQPNYLPGCDSYGSNSIQRYLNNHLSDHPPFGKTGKWYRSYIQKILGNPAVYGEFQPHKMDQGKRVPDGSPIPNYFPVTVPKSDFLLSKSQVSSRKLSGSGRKGPQFSNLFTRLAACGHCGATIGFLNKGKLPRGGNYLRCVNASSNSSCNAPSWKYDDFEQSFIEWITEVNLDEILNPTDITYQLESLAATKLSVSERLEELKIEAPRRIEWVDQVFLGGRFSA